MDTELNLPHLLRSRLTLLATQAVLRGGGMLKREREGASPAESAKKIEETTIATIKTSFPDHSFFTKSDESTETATGIQWLIDPINGSMNYLNGIPLFSISIAAAFRNEILASAIYNPMTDELFIAEKGQGAYLNGKKLRVTETAVLDNAVLGTEFPQNAQENPLHYLEHFTTFTNMGIPMRIMGTPAIDLAYLAAGHYDAFWAVSLQPWEYGAGKLLIEEAGGKFTDFHAKPYENLIEGSVLTSNGRVHEQMINNIQATLEEMQSES